jgi:hypothetical protein
MKTQAIFFLITLTCSSVNAVTLYTYASAGCGGSPTSTTNYTLNTCYDISQGGQQGSNKVVACNATTAQIDIYIGSNACAGTPGMINTAVPNACINDGSGGYMKIICDPLTPTSSAPMATTAQVTTIQVTTTNANPGTTKPGTTAGTTQTPNATTMISLAHNIRSSVVIISFITVLVTIAII